MVLKNIFGCLLVVTFCNIYSQTLNYYFGNLHSHTYYSDGNKDYPASGCNNPTCSYNYAKASLHFDFLGITEHNHASAGLSISEFHSGYAQAESANQEGIFLCLWGIEWGVLTNSSDGHVIIYGFDDKLLGWEVGNYDIYVAKSDYDALFRKVKNNPNAFCYLAHPGNNNFGYLSSNPYNATYDSAIVAVPFRSGPAFSTNTSYSDYPAGDYLNYYKILLAKGYKIGCGYDHDNHYTTFGRCNAGRLVILAPSLTTTDFYYAMKNMHFYGSDDWNAKIDFKVNATNIMGDIVTSSFNPTITVVHNDEDGEMADSIKLWTGYSGSGVMPSVIQVVKNNNLLNFVDNSINLNMQRYYFIEIVQQDGQRIVTSPIWYTKDTTAYVSSLSNQNNLFLIFPNPIRDILSVSSLIGDYDLKIYDVMGRITIVQHIDQNNGNIDITDIPGGIYFIQIEKYGEVLYYQKFIKN